MKEPMELSVDECLNLLAGEVFGRLAVVTPGGPRIVPVNYALLDDSVVLRTSPYSELAQHAVGKDAAFEIDEVDHTRQTGWSVVAVGRLEEVEPDRPRRACARRGCRSRGPAGSATSTSSSGGARSAGGDFGMHRPPRCRADDACCDRYGTFVLTTTCPETMPDVPLLAKVWCERRGFGAFILREHQRCLTW